MKKNLNLKSFVAIFAASTLFACTQDGIDNLSVQTEKENEAMNELPKRRTYEEALAVAQDAIGLLGENCTTRSGKPRSINTADVQYIVNTSSTRSTEEPDTLMYVFNYEDNAGFAIVSANRATEDLIAVTEQGNYVAGEETGNGGFDLYMDMAEEYVTMAAAPLPGIGGDQEILTEFKMFVDRDTITYGPYISVRWGQDWPYNRACPVYNGNPTKAGCVAIAIAQIMTYYQHPNSFTVNYAPTIYDQTLDWDLILEHRFTEDGESETCSQCSTTGGHYIIGSLIREIGQQVEMVYDVDESGCDSEMFARSALQHFGYACGSYQAYSSNIVSNSILNRKLVYMRGGISADDGHAWVIDGYRLIHEVHRECVKPINALEWTELRRWTENHYYHHINWGWDGESNGFFLFDVFDTARPSQLDPGMSIVGSNYNFTVDLKIIPNISKQ